MKRKIYTVPCTELFRVEVEGTFAGSVVQEDPESQVTIEDQQWNTIDATNETWNNGTWE